MRALMTGAGSFTGCWFARALAGGGCAVVATCRRPLADYDGLAATRLAQVGRHATIVPGCGFGDPAFVDLLRQDGPFDLLALHGAEAAGHRSRAFDVMAAVAANTREAASVCEAFAGRGGRAVLVTGSIFEADEGVGTPPHGAFNPYGLAKTLTWQTLRFAAEQAGLAVGKFVIAHPFGPLEKPGLTSYLARIWLAGAEAVVEQPQLVRDFVPVDALAEAYAGFATRLVRDGRSLRLAPSLYAEATASFVERFARAMRERLDRPCRWRANPAPAPTREPRVRCNPDSLRALVPGWSEAGFWDGLAAWYRSPSMFVLR